MTVEVFGSLNIDHIVHLHRLPRPGETVLAQASQTALGGKGANQAVAAARLGATTRLFGFVGDDDDGHTLRAKLHYEGVDIQSVTRLPGEKTGVAHVMVDRHGENAIAVSSGANRPSIYRWPERSADEPTVVLTQFEMAPDLTERFLNERAGAPFRIINAAPFDAQAARLFALANVLVVNETELADYIGEDNVGEGDALIDQARSLTIGFDAWVIVTRGRRGALAVNRQTAIWTNAPQVKAIDTTGAGDCFVGALAASLDGGAPLPRALTLATLAASLSVQRAGGSASMPRRDELSPLAAALSDERA